MGDNLTTTNLLLGILALVSVFEALVVVGVGVVGLVIYRRVMNVVNTIETRQLARAFVRLNEILDDLKDVTAKVRDETERVDYAIRTTMDRVDDTAERVRSTLREKTSRVVAVVLGLRTAVEAILRSREQTAAGKD